MGFAHKRFNYVEGDRKRRCYKCQQYFYESAMTKIQGNWYCTTKRGGGGCAGLKQSEIMDSRQKTMPGGLGD